MNNKLVLLEWLEKELINKETIVTYNDKKSYKERNKLWIDFFLINPEKKDKRIAVILSSIFFIWIFLLTWGLFEIKGWLFIFLITILFSVWTFSSLYGSSKLNFNREENLYLLIQNLKKEDFVFGEQEKEYIENLTQIYSLCKNEKELDFISFDSIYDLFPEEDKTLFMDLQELLTKLLKQEFKFTLTTDLGNSKISFGWIFDDYKNDFQYKNEFITIIFDSLGIKDSLLNKDDYGDSRTSYYYYSNKTIFNFLISKLENPKSKLLLENLIKEFEESWNPLFFIDLTKRTINLNFFIESKLSLIYKNLKTKSSLQSYNSYSEILKEDPSFQEKIKFIKKQRTLKKEEEKKIYI